MNTSSSYGSLTLRTPSEIKESEDMANYLDKRVGNIERHFNNLNKEFIGYARRTAKLRNNGDEISAILHSYINSQEFNVTSTEALKEFCGHLSIAEDMRNAELERLKVHVIKPILDYLHQMKTLKTDIKREMTSRKKELKSSKTLQRTTQKSGQGSAEEAKARAQSHLVTLNAITNSERLTDTVKKFEKMKLETIQGVLRSFIHIEMLWHMRALERYTEAYNSLNGINCDSDLQQFVDNLNNFHYRDFLTKTNSNLNLAGKRSMSLTNLRSTNSSSQGDLTGTGVKADMRASVTFEDQMGRSKSYTQPRESSVRAQVASTVSSKPPVANGHNNLADNISSEDDDDESDSEYTEDDPTTTSRNTSARTTNRSGSQPIPAKRNK